SEPHCVRIRRPGHRPFFILFTWFVGSGIPARGPRWRDVSGRTRPQEAVGPSSLVGVANESGKDRVVGPPTGCGSGTTGSSPCHPRCAPGRVGSTRWWRATQHDARRRNPGQGCRAPCVTCLGALPLLPVAGARRATGSDLPDCPGATATTTSCPGDRTRERSTAPYLLTVIIVPSTW